MNGTIAVDRIRTPAGTPSPKLRVVDLSERPVLDADNPVPKAIMEALTRTASGVLTTEEVLAAARGHPASEAERALHDLSLRGLVRVIWQTPFRFVAVLRTQDGTTTRNANRATRTPG